jgi:hypothetical protein
MRRKRAIPHQYRDRQPALAHDVRERAIGHARELEAPAARAAELFEEATVCSM